MYKKYKEFMELDLNEDEKEADSLQGLSGRELAKRIDAHDPVAAAAVGRNSIRLFVSSTFTDTKTERNYLMQHVYPDIREFCQQRQLQFSVVDLRWGIREHATDDHRATDICLSEIDRCNSSTIHGAPSFIYLGYDRYGGPSLPRLVSKKEMELLLPCVKDAEVLDLIGEWYKRDDNAIPPEYVLQPISSQITDFAKTTDPSRIKELRTLWMGIENKMLGALSKAAVSHPALSEKQKSKWIMSTTHKEVEHFLRKTGKRKPNALMYERKIEEFKYLKKSNENMGKLVWRYIDVDDDYIVDDDKQRLLLRQKIEMKSKDVPFKSSTVNWDPKGVLENTHEEYLKKFAENVKEDLQTKISEALGSKRHVHRDVIETASHVRFCTNRLKGFHGRAELLQKALKYFESGEEGRQMLVIHGLSGAGKTSFMSKLAVEAKRKMEELGRKPVFTIKYCGTTASSSTAKGVMHSVSPHSYIGIAAVRHYSPPFRHFNDNVKRFHRQLGLASKKTPVLVFIDSLDQLTDDDLARNNTDLWLPEKLPAHAYLVVSTLPEIGGCLNSLKTQNISSSNFLEVERLPLGDVDMIFHKWLTAASRTLQPEQRNQLIKMANEEVEGEKPTALRIKLLFDLASKWTSYEQLETVSPSVSGLLNFFFEKLEDTHGKILVQRFFGLMNAAKRGLSEEELVDIISTDDEVMDSVFQFHQPPLRRLPQIVYSRLRNGIGEYIVERGAHGKTVLAWYHRQFHEICKARYRESARTENVKISRIPSSQLIAAYFSEDAHVKFPDRALTPQPLFWRKDKDNCDFNFSKLSEMPYAFYLLESRFNKERSALTASEHMCNLTFISAKCDAGLGRELVKDFSDILGTLKAKLKRQSVKTTRNGDKGEKVHKLERGLHKISDYFRFITSNIHIFEMDQETLKVYQQAINMPNSNAVQHEAQHKTISDVSPWKEPYIVNRTRTVIVQMINKPMGEGSNQFTMSGHEKEVTDIAFIKGIHIVSSSKDGFIMVWSAATAEILLKINVGASVEQIRISQADKSLYGIAAVDITGKVHFTTINHGEDGIDSTPLTSWQAHESPVDHIKLAYKNDDTKIITVISKRNGDNDFRGELKMWRIPQWMEKADEKPILEVTDVSKLKTIPHEDLSFGIWSVDYSPDDKYVLTILTGDCSMSLMQNILSILDGDTLEPLWSWAFMNVNPPTLSIQSCSSLQEKPTNQKRPSLSEWDILVPKHNGISRLRVCVMEHNRIVGIHLWDKEMPSYDHKMVFNDKYGATTLLGVKDEIKLLQCPPVDAGDPSEWGDCNSMESLLGEPDMKDGGKLKGHGARVKVLCTDSTQSICYSGYSDGSLTVWDLSLMQSYITHKSHESQIFSIALSPDRTMVVTGGGLGVMYEPTDIKCWDPRTGELLGSSEPLDEYLVNSMEFTPDGAFLTCHCSSRPRIVKFVDTSALKNEKIDLGSGFEVESPMDSGSASIPTLAMSSGPVDSTPSIHGTNTLHISTDGRFLCTTMGNSTSISIVDISTKICCNYTAHVGAVLGGIFSPDGKYLATWCSPFTNPRELIKTTPDAVCQVKLWSVSCEGTLEEVAVYDLVDESQTPVVKGDNEVPGMVNKAGFTSIVFSAEGTLLFAATTKGHIMELTVPELKSDWKPELHHQIINHIAIVPYDEQHSFLLTCSDDRWVKVSDSRELHYLDGGLAQYYIGAKVTCVTGFRENDTLFIQCTDSHGRLHVLKVHIPDLLKVCHYNKGE